MFLDDQLYTVTVLARRMIRPYAGPARVQGIDILVSQAIDDLPRNKNQSS